MTRMILPVLCLTAVGVIAACHATQQASYHDPYNPGYNQVYYQDPNDNRWYYYDNNHQRVYSQNHSYYQFAPPTPYSDNH